MYPKLSPEGWKTARAAIRDGWGPTLRLVVIMTVPAVMMTMLWYVLMVVR